MFRLALAALSAALIAAPATAAGPISAIPTIALAAGQKDDGAKRAAEKRRQQEAAKRAADKRRQQEAARRAAEKRRQQEQAKRAADERRRQEQARRAADERRKQEQARRAADERRKQEQARRAADERRRQEQARRAADERRRQEQARRVADERRKQEQARRAADERRKQDQARRAADERRRQDQARRVADQRAREEKARRNAAEQKRLLDDARRDLDRRTADQRAQRERASREADLRREFDRRRALDLQNDRRSGSRPGESAQDHVDRRRIEERERQDAIKRLADRRNQDDRLDALSTERLVPKSNRTRIEMPAPPREPVVVYDPEGGRTPESRKRRRETEERIRSIIGGNAPSASVSGLTPSKKTRNKSGKAPWDTTPAGGFQPIADDPVSPFIPESDPIADSVLDDYEEHVDHHHHHHHHDYYCDDYDACHDDWDYHCHSYSVGWCWDWTWRWSFSFSIGYSRYWFPRYSSYVPWRWSSWSYHSDCYVYRPAYYSSWSRNYTWVPVCDPWGNVTRYRRVWRWNDCYDLSWYARPASAWWYSDCRPQSTVTYLNTSSFDAANDNFYNDFGAANYEVAPLIPALPDVREGWMLLSEGNWHAALEVFAELYEVEPYEAEARIGYALAQAAIGREDAASTAMREAMLIDPEAILYLDQELLEEQLQLTLAIYDARIRDRYDDVDALFMIAATRAMLGEYSVAWFAIDAAYRLGDSSSATAALRLMIDTELQVR